MDKTVEKARLKRANLTAARLKELLHYDPLTGSFTWLVTKSNKAKAGDPAGYMAGGYVLIGIDGVKYQAHVLAWLYMTGSMPTGLLDHKDTDRANNRWENLREATRSQNNANVSVRSHSKLGVKGVQRHRSGRFIAKIQFEGQQKYLGIFDTIDEAAAAYKKAADLRYSLFSRS